MHAPVDHNSSIKEAIESLECRLLGNSVAYVQLSIDNAERLLGELMAGFSFSVFDDMTDNLVVVSR